MLIYVQAFAGKTFTIEVESSDSIKRIKNEISDIEGVPSEQQRIFLIQSGKNVSEIDAIIGPPLHTFVQFQKPAEVDKLALYKIQVNY